MKMTIQVVIEDGGTTPQAAAAKVISLERNVEDLRPETLGLKLDEAKEILAEIQTVSDVIWHDQIGEPALLHVLMPTGKDAATHEQADQL